MKEHKKYLSIFAALLLAVFAIVCVFGVACKGNKEEDGPEPSPEITVEHTHSYEASWDWGTDYTTCDVTLTCTSTESECDSPTVKDMVTTTSVETTKATCEGTGLKTYTATYEYDGKTYTDTKTETLAALGHAWPANDDAENVDWQWESRTDGVVSLVVTCDRCGVTLLDEEVEYETEETDEATILSAEYEVDETLTYTSEYDTANDPEEHVHHYEPTAWDWFEDYTTCTVTLTCESVVGECPEEEETITKDAAVTSEETTPATCEEEGEMTYTATLEYNGHTYTDTKTEAIEALGHDYDAANATWEWTVDSEGKAAATVTIACSRDSSHTAWSNTQTDIEIGTDGLYHASITGPDNVTPLTDDYKVVEVQREYHIDFSDPDTYEWIGTPTSTGDTQYGDFLYLDITEAKEYTTGILSFKSISGQSVNKENDGSLFTSKATSDGTYFMIDLSAFEGSYVSITAVFIANGSGTRSMYVTKSASTSSYLTKKESGDRDNNVTLAYTYLISAGDVLYLTWDNNIRIFSIDIEIVDEDPDYCHCATPSYPETTDTEHIVWDWDNRDEDNQKVNVTIYCTECGKIIESVTTNYAVDQNDETKWTASIEAGGNTYTSTFDIPVEGEKATTESFIVPKKSGEEADTQTYSAGDKVVSNSLFELTTMDSMKYAVGGTGNNNISSVTLTDMAGESHTFDQALESGTTLTPTITATEMQTDENGNESQVATAVTAASNDDILEVKAIADATVYLYLTLTNDSYSVNPSGTIYYTVNDGEKVSVSVSSRTTITTLTLELLTGDVVKIGAEHSTLNSAKTTAQSLHIWLFGAEAISAGAEEVGLPKVSVNFSDSSTYAWINDYVKDDDGNDTAVISNEKTFYDGILSLVTSSSTGTGMQIDGSGSTYYLRTGGATQSSGRYFAIDLSSYAGKYVSISVVFCTQTNNNERSLMLSKNSSTNSIDSTDVIAYASNSSNSGAATRTTFSYILPVTGETLYLTFGAEIRIYSIEIEVLDEAEPTVTGWTVALTPDTTTLTYVDENTELTTNLTLTISMEGDDDAVYEGGYSILSSDTAVMTVAEDEGGNIVVTAVGNGEATITVRLWDDPGKYATVTVTVTGIPTDGESD